MRIGPPDGIEVGPPLEEFHGVLTGTPEYRGGAGELIGRAAGPVSAAGGDRADRGG